jgi:hypothetical protein
MKAVPVIAERAKFEFFLKFHRVDFVCHCMSFPHLEKFSCAEIEIILPTAEII